MSVALAVSMAPVSRTAVAVTGRDKYDALILQPGSQIDKRARNLVAEAVRAGILEEPGITGDHKRWAALNHDVYAVAAAGRVIVVQERSSWRNKYGVQHRKRYVLLYRDEGRVVGHDLSAASVRGALIHDSDPAAPVRRMVNILPAGLAEAVRHTGRADWAKTKRQRREGGDNFFKAVAVVQDDDGTVHLRSIYDETVEYRLGVTMRQAVRTGHGGGYYVRRTLEAAARVAVPEESDLADAPRAVLRCRCAGNYTRYANGKIAFSRVTPLEIVSWPAGIPRPDGAAVGAPA